MAMKEHYAHVPSFLEASRQECANMIFHMEKARPNPSTTDITLRAMRRLYTPEASSLAKYRKKKKPATMKAFTIAVDQTEKAQWVAWHWDTAPDSHIHPAMCTCTKPSFKASRSMRCRWCLRCRFGGPA